MMNARVIYALMAALFILLSPVPASAQVAWTVPGTNFGTQPWWGPSQQAQRFATSSDACDAVVSAYCGSITSRSCTPNHGAEVGGTSRPCSSMVVGIYEPPSSTGSPVPVATAIRSNGPCNTGSTCTSQCAEQSIGNQNFTVGWSTKPPGVLGAAAIDALPDSSFFPSACKDTCRIDTGGSTASRCWHSTKPTAAGLYRLSCDFAAMRRAEACTPTSTDPASPSTSPPPCTGSVGTVNGKTACLNPPVTSQIQLPKPGYGNPRAGTSPDNNSNVREPTTELGGGPDNRGGPSVTDGPDGSRGTGSNRIPGTGTQNPDTGVEGPQIEFPTDYARDATVQGLGTKLDAIKSGQCGGTNQPKCKIDETGTPTGADVDQGAKQSLDTESSKLDVKLSQVVAGDGAPDRSWGFSISFPSTCTPLQITTRSWGNFTLNFCQWQPIVHDLMSMVWAAFTIWICIGMVFRAVNS
jgi:hypothetical protein